MSSKIGFIDNSEGGNIRTLPAEMSGSQCLTSKPLLPGTRVIVNGTHPQKTEWADVTVYIGDVLLSGYVQGFRITTGIPEIDATLHHVREGDRLEPLAAKMYRQGIEPGHDLRFYENVILYVNQKAGRVGVQRIDGDVRLVEGHRIWLVSVAFARKLKGIVDSGSITGGAVAKAKQAVQHMEDIFASVQASPRYFGEVTGQYKDAILENLPKIIGIVLAFMAAEFASAFLAAVPTGVSQLAAAIIQLGLAAYGVKDMIDAGVEAVKYATLWITQAWQANGNAQKIAEACKSFLRMVMSIAMVALSKLGVKSNFQRGLKLAQGVKITPPRLEYMVAATNSGQAVAVPIFRPGSITATAGAGFVPKPTTVLATTLKRSTQGAHSDKPSIDKPSVKQSLDDAELEKLLEKAPNGERLKKFVGRRIPAEGTQGFNALKAELAKEGYTLDVMTKGGQKYRIRRLDGKAQDLAPLTVTEHDLIALTKEGPARISLYSRYRKNYLDWIEQTQQQGKAAREAAAARISAGEQLHHLIPDAVAQKHPLILEAIERLKSYTIDRGTNIIDMPSAPNAESRFIHSGSHPNYSNYVTSRLEAEMRKLGPLSKASPQRIHEAILKVENSLREAIGGGKLPPEVLREIYENGVLVGKKLAMLDPRPNGGFFTA